MNLFPMKNSFESKKDYKKERKKLHMVDTPLERNKTPYKSFDCSLFNKDDVVLLVDGDWLAFSSTSKEMERYLEYKSNGEILEFSGYKPFKEYCVNNNIEYKPSNVEKKQRNHDLAVAFSKSSVKKKIAYGIEVTGATRVVILCGSDGNDRALLPLPKLNDKDCFIYKGFREAGWVPDTLSEVKEWMMNNWLSHWSVSIETDDDLTIAKKTLDDMGIVNFIYAVDKDFLGEMCGGMFVVSHQKKPEYFENTPENNLGYIKAIKTDGGSDKMTGRGDMFLCYQICVADDPDGYSAKDMMKKFGTLKTFGYKACEKYLMQATSRKHLWELVVQHFVKYLPKEFEYEDCFGVVQKATPMSMLNLYYKCAKMREVGDVEPDVFKDRLIPLGVSYDS